MCVNRRGDIGQGMRKDVSVGIYTADKMYFTLHKTILFEMKFVVYSLDYICKIEIDLQTTYRLTQNLHLLVPPG